MGFSNIPLLRIGDLELALIQGGMGVGISCAGLASAVANEGGLGVIAAVGLNEVKSYSGSYKASSSGALMEEIRLTRSMMNGKRALGVNILRALSNYSDLVQTAIDEGADAVISGAGPPLDMPKYLHSGSNTKLIPIVSSAKAAVIMIKYWRKKYGYTPDAIIVEGPLAGGHLGFKPEQIFNPDYSLEKLIPEVVKAVSDYETKTRKIPVIAAGGIFYGSDIKKILELGASGVQMATRFVTTYECDAPPEFKQAYLNCKKEDLVIIDSPVGMPGRAIDNDFLRRVRAGTRMPVNCKYRCLDPCDPYNSPYCIARALVNSSKGDLENGFAFAGANAWRCGKEGIISVKELFRRLDREHAEGITSS